MKKKNLIFFGIIAAVSMAAIIALITYNISNKKDNIVINVSGTVSESENAEENSDFSGENAKKTDKTKKSAKNKSNSKKKSTKKNRSSRKSAKSVKNNQKTTEKTDISFPIELNSASAEELCAIKGIGETLAEKIISYRESIGGFINRDQLLDVDGIGEAKYAAIREYLWIENEQELPQEETDSEVTENVSDDEVSDDNLPDDEEIICIELNSAELEDLEMIPCFDEEMCGNILKLRDEIGHFSDIYELLYAEGMTKTLFCEAEKYLYVEIEDTE